MADVASPPDGERYPSTRDPFNAFAAGANRLTGSAGALSGSSFAVKSNIDVAGFVSDNGHPLWASTHAPAAADAAVVAELIGAGARLIGKTRMDEMAYSLLGDNPHYAPPLNPAAPERHTGGSSSGSAVAVAGGLVDFAIGTDTAGSCRAPAAFCGVCGFRASHDAISMQGVIPLAPSFDTIGWFARDIDTMIAVGDALLPPDARTAAPEKIYRLSEAFDGLDPAFSAGAAPLIARLDVIDGGTARIGDATLDDALAHFRNLQAFEAWRSVGDWITANKPEFGPGVAQRFAIAAKVTPDEKQAAEAFGSAFRATIDALLDDAGVIVLPTAPFPAPKLDTDPAQLDSIRYRLMRFFIIASFCGLPQVSVPIPTTGAPLGLSFIGRRGSDRALLGFTRLVLAGEVTSGQ